MTPDPCPIAARPVPPIGRHPTGQAYCRWSSGGRRHTRYFGLFGSAAADEAYRAFAARWQASPPPLADRVRPAPPPPVARKARPADLMPRCRACGRNAAVRPARGLCDRCARNPDVLAAHPVLKSYRSSRRGVAGGNPATRPLPVPTDIPPGPGKVDVLAERARAGFALFHPRDAR